VFFSQAGAEQLTVSAHDLLTQLSVRERGGVGTAMMDDPILRFVFGFLFVLATAFGAGVLLFQLKLRAIWCFVAAEVTLLAYCLAVIRPVAPWADHWLVMPHVIGLPILLAPLFAGYYFNKHVIDS
jgi:hypothetical protein